MITRQVWKIKKAGSLARLQLKEDVLPDPKEGEVQVKVKAIGLNFADIFACLGLYSATPKGEFIPGLEFSGTISKIGKEDHQGDFFRVGDNIIGVTRFGAYATHLNVSPKQLRVLPEKWSFEEGAAFPVGSLTAWYGLKNLGNLQPEQTVLIHSAAGGVGLRATKISKEKKLNIIATVGSLEKAMFLKEQTGLDDKQIIVRNSKKFNRQLENALASINDDGFDIVFDAIYGDFFKPAYQRIKPGGRYVLYGASSMLTHGLRPHYGKLIYRYLKRPRLDPLSMISENKSTMGFNLIWLWDQVEQMEAMMGEILSMIKKPPYIGHRYHFNDTSKAIRFFQSGKTMGKVILHFEDK